MTNESGSATAGGLLRAAREKQGLHIAALAASIKVAPRKLDALENNRWDELSGTTFTRALAQSVCRALRIDATPVLALLPPARTVELDHVSGKLNTPFRERAARDEGALAAVAQRSLLWAGGLLLLAAVVTYWMPSSWLQFDASPLVAAPASAVVAKAGPSAPAAVVASAAIAATAETAASAAPAEAVATSGATAAATSGVVEVTHGAPVALASAVAEGASAGALQLSASEVSWVEVRDRGGRILLSRNVQRGETIAIDGASPLRLTIGNAAVTRVVYRGKTVALTPGQRDNVARIELN